MIEKNKRKKDAKRQRVWFDMNTGTRTHADNKHPNRNKEKRNLKKMVDKLEY